jgi:hypothetical protein
MFVFAFVFAKNVRLPPRVSRWLGGCNQAATAFPFFQHWSGDLIARTETADISPAKGFRFLFSEETL